MIWNESIWHNKTSKQKQKMDDDYILKKNEVWDWGDLWHFWNEKQKINKCEKSCQVW